ncbi:MAG: hypothetical protein K0S45_3219 [Nitrospira sp.]|jgi:hypothetical protein|nr:hypothetical protein [Nitrospira sp.]
MDSTFDLTLNNVLITTRQLSRLWPKCCAITIGGSIVPARDKPMKTAQDRFTMPRPA